MCIFSPHNVIKDPPFSSLDLISCRNLLIYLENDLQRKLVPLFHYALRPGGYLFLGPSENIANYTDLFRRDERAVAVGSNGSGRRLLLVEDDDDAAHVMALLLSQLGFEVTACSRIEDAFEALSGDKFEILISDLGLPDGSGYDLIRRVRNAGHTLPAIALSGFGMESDIITARQAGFDVHLTKPVDVARIESVIGGLLNRRPSSSPSDLGILPG